MCVGGEEEGCLFVCLFVCCFVVVVVVVVFVFQDSTNEKFRHPITCTGKTASAMNLNSC